MKIHVLCPFYRISYILTLVYYLEPFGIEWYPIVAPKEDVEFHREWIHPIKVKELEPGEQCYRKINDFIETQPIINDDYYCFMCDETSYEPGFFDVIRYQTSDIIFCSMYRGDTIPKDGSAPHPATTLRLTKISDIKLGYVGLPSCVIKGRILKQVRFCTNSMWCDGKFMVTLATQFQKELITILPNTYVFANYLQPGRYTDKTKFLKPNWELPKFV